MGRHSTKKSGPCPTPSRRKRLRRERNAELNKVAARKAADENLRNYVPTPPGIIYYDRVQVITLKGPREILAPRHVPMAMLAHHLCDDVLTDEEIIGLLSDLKGIADKRGLAVDWKNPLKSIPSNSLICASCLVSCAIRAPMLILGMRTSRTFRSFSKCWHRPTRSTVSPVCS